MKTWADLLLPEYVLAGVEAFLVGALPLWGLGSIDTESMSRGLILPTAAMIFAGFGAGALNGVRAIRTLGMAPPVRTSVPPGG